MSHRHQRFSILRFSVMVLLQVTALLAGMRFLLPDFWRAQLAAGPGAFFVVFAVAHLGLCFFEWFFHRYVLHGVAAPWLKGFASEHRHHHSLTPIRLRPVTQGSDRFILNEYPIVSEEQFPSSAFPPWSLAAFWGVFTPVLVGFQFLFPAQPVMLAGYAAITFSMALYEILHAIEHWPYEWWQRATERSRLSPIWKRVYGFHHMHHANIGCNESISGFFGLPIADWCFGTYHQPKELLLEGRIATARDFAVPPPLPFVRWADRWIRKREAGILRETR